MTLPGESIYNIYMTTAKLFKNGNSQAVRLPKAFRFQGDEVAIRREGDSVMLEPVRPDAWPRGFFKRIAIKDESFARPPQGKMPRTLKLG